MKHTIKVTLALVLFFFIAQIIGLLIINQYIDHKKTLETKKIEYKSLPYDMERPEVQNQSTSFIYITIAILIGTALIFLLIRFKKPFIWKFWFFLSVFFTLLIAFYAFVNIYIATGLAFAIAVLKLYKPNIVIQNMSEIFIYGGLAAFVLNIFNLFAVFMLLIVISIYDFIAVFKTKHMVKLAKFQSESNVFAGLYIPYEREKIQIKGKITLSRKSLSSSAQPKKSVAILGGGDIGFTLIFAGAVMKDLMLHQTQLAAFLYTLLIPVCATIALLFLLLKGKQNKFYPAMPILTAGCFIGFLIILLF